MSESVVQCEGYHDRAFWAALLEHLGRGVYRQVWEDSRVVGELIPRLQGCGAWRIAEALADC